MILLGIETSSPAFSVAVAEQGKPKGFLQETGTGRASDLLADLIERVLAQAGLTLAQIDGFAVSIGPGSFTGLRVGVTTAKTLSWALKKPVAPISSLEVIAQNVRATLGVIQPFLDARKGKVYTARFSSEGRRLIEDQLLLPEDALKLSPEPAILVGDGLKRYDQLAAEKQAQSWQLAEQAQWVPRADHLCRLAASAWPGNALEQTAALVPKYLYSQESNIIGW